MPRKRTRWALLLFALAGLLQLTGATDICHVGGRGIVLPLFGDSEQNWPKALRMVLYFVGLLWSFIGVGIVADVFMSAIEVITSQEKTIKLANGATVNVKVWNATVANLTLMAFGSSAPEIMLSVIEIMGNKYFSGDLGPSTIVGSAAFNLMVIIAVCVIAIPSPEVRKIEDLGVFSITASCSIFAYLWLLFILVWVTPDVVTVTEALLTLFYFPLLVFVAYLADTGWFSKRSVVPSHLVRLGPTVLKPFELSEMLGNFGHKKKMKLNPDEALNMMNNLMIKEAKPTRAQLRVNATRILTGGKRVVANHQGLDVEALAAANRRRTHTGAPKVSVGFESTRYHVIEADGHVLIRVQREPTTGETSVDYATHAGTATANEDYTETSGTLHFANGEQSKDIKVAIIDDDEAEEDENFFVRLTNCVGGELEAESNEAEVVIIDDDEPGKLGFHSDDISVKVMESCGHVGVWVSRSNGNHGVLTCNYRTEMSTAVPGVDYVGTEGTIEFRPGEMRKEIKVEIIDDQSYEKNEHFKVVLSDIKGPTTHAAFSEFIECTVTIVNDPETRKLIDDVSKLLEEHPRAVQALGHSSWEQQFREALEVGGGDDNGDDGEKHPPSMGDYIMHTISLPWKLTFALIPPTDYYNGLVTFVVSLAMIGAVTTLIGDIAALFGCVIGLENSVTAITFVALGTSLPDTFASKAAAQADDTADAAVGNVTGSNSVNVFVGLGLPWSIAALYWASQGRTADWEAKYGGPGGEGSDPLAPNLYARYSDGAGYFAVPAGNLGTSVAIFTVCACTCLMTLLWRRKVYGGELGGPEGPQKATFLFFAFLWLTYVILSALQTYGVIFAA